MYVVSYLAFGLPAVIAGFLAPHVGLRPVVDGYVALVVVAGVAGLIASVRTGRRTPRHSAAVPGQLRRTPEACPLQERA